jgi:hypothetical protein
LLERVLRERAGVELDPLERAAVERVADLAAVERVPLRLVAERVDAERVEEDDEDARPDAFDFVSAERSWSKSLSA